MTATLNDVNSPKKKSERSPEEAAAAELVKLAKEQGESPRVWWRLWSVPALA